MNKVTMPEPEAFLYLNGEHRGVSLNLRGDMDLSDGTVRYALITTDQAEAYADAKVREALEEAALQSQDREDALRYRWLRDTLHGAKAGGGVEVNEARQVYETPEPGEEVRVYWYQDTPVGFYQIHGTTLDEAIDHARRIEENK